MWIGRAAMVAVGAGWFGGAMAPEAPKAENPKLRVLVVGGGPNKQYNQVGIESNVRYMERLLPAEAPRRILFADGSLDTPTVLYEDEKGKELFRKPKITQIDGSSGITNIQTEFRNLGSALEASPKTSALLYFTGHGSPESRGGFDNNSYGLWDGKEFTVKDLATNLDAIPKTTPTALVMVECFSGAFANLLFEGGAPDGKLTGRRLCGFFASVPQRMSAGCTPTTDESEYHDFTGYFFGALTGTDRVGRKVTDADYDGNGKVGMNEAFAYTLIHDDSIDTPVCTSDTFLRHFITTPDPEIFKNSYSDVLKWASPAQKAALTSLCDHLKLTGDDILGDAYKEFASKNPSSESDRFVHLIRFVRLAKSVVLAESLKKTGDRDTKKAFQTLLKDEAGNPLVD